MREPKRAVPRVAIASKNPQTQGWRLTSFLGLVLLVLNSTANVLAGGGGALKESFDPPGRVEWRPHGGRPDTRSNMARGI